MPKPLAVGRKRPEDLALQARIADLEREGRFKDKRIAELKAELDEQRALVHEMEEHIAERDETLEHFVQAFGLVLNDDGKYGNSEFLTGHDALIGKYNDLVARHNKLVGIVNRHIARLNPPGRPMATSEVQQAEILKHHKTGRSSRWIAGEMSLSRQAVMTVIDKRDGTDRTTQQRRRKLGIEPKIKDWRVASRERMPKALTKHLTKGRALLKEAKGLR
jgi:uncharacterized coiled-coil protein SlyX